MLRGILYETIQADAAGATVRLLPESPVYQGHFPGYPITPGVCLVQMAMEIIGEMADQVGHDGKTVGHDGKTVGHDGKTVGHDGKTVGHDGSKVSHDGKVVRLVAAKNIKFTTPVEPGEGGRELRFNLKETGPGMWSVEILSGGVPCAKMSLTVA